MRIAWLGVALCLPGLAAATPPPNDDPFELDPPEPERVPERRERPERTDHITLHRRSQPDPSQPPLMQLEPTSRLDLFSIPDLGVLEPALKLDRRSERRRSFGMVGSLTLGAGRHDGDNGLAASAVLGVGKHTRGMFAAAVSELTGTDDELIRGRHRALLHIGTLDGKRELDGMLDIAGAIEHGEARGLAPVNVGPGRRDTADVESTALLRFCSCDDAAFVGVVRGGAGGTRWHDAATLDRASRRSLGLGVGIAPADGELPRGVVDFLQARVEHASIARPVAAAGALRDTEVRTVDVGIGTRDLTLHVDRELVGVVAVNFGWRWLESEGAAGRLAEDMFHMQIATHMKWWTRDQAGPRRIGLALAREPTYTPNGQRLVSDWRLDLISGFEDKRGSVNARGGISWVTPIAGDDPTTHTLLRYGIHVEGFFKVVRNLEVGVYHAQTFEPQVAGDPWASPRGWGVESGVVARISAP